MNEIELHHVTVLNTEVRNALSAFRYNRKSALDRLLIE